MEKDRENNIPKNTIEAGTVKDNMLLINPGESLPPSKVVTVLGEVYPDGSADIEQVPCDDDKSTKQIFQEEVDKAKKG